MKNLTSSLILRLGIIFLVSGILLTSSGCKKHTDNTTTEPTKFTELKVASNFRFESFINLNVTIGIANPGSQTIFVIQVFQDDPSKGGQLIATGATDNTLQYKTTLRVPTRLTQLWVGKIATSGITEYKAVPITGTTFSYTFGQKNAKSVEGTESNDCSTGCTSTANTSGTYTVNAGQFLCISGGTSSGRLQLNLTINTGGYARICGYANVIALSGSGTLGISPSGDATIPLSNITTNIENYGTTQVAVSGNNATINLMDGISLHNWGTFNISNSLNVKGILINEGPFTIIQSLATQSSGRIINKCALYVNDPGNNSFNIVTGTASLPGLVNDVNGYIQVAGDLNFTGQGYVSLGLQSLILCSSFDIEGQVAGPGSQGSQIHSTTGSKTTGGASLTGYIDLWAAGGISPSNGTYGPHITFHNPGYTIPVPSCNTPVPPSITSLLTAASVAGSAITPYVITATGTETITYSVSNLPSGLSFNAVTHTISGTVASNGVYSLGLTADNFVGTDNKTLVLTVTGGTPPTITSPLTGSTTVNLPYSYTITASGVGTITYNATNLPAGLSFNAGTHQITGTPTVAGTYNITLTATNSGGTDTKTLVLTVGTPPTITSALTATGTTGQQFPTYTVTASGNSPITYTASNMPAGLTYDQATHTINGTPTTAGPTNVALTATNAFGTDSKILVITITQGVVPPVITSSLTAAGTTGQSFSYSITASGTTPITFTATGLPAGLTFSGSTISGIPTQTGTFNVPLTATNSGGTDAKTLVITIGAPSPTDTDGDGVPDNIDAYPLDPTRAFNSYFPNQTDFGSYAFEDLWPAYGDYDCNDLVMNFNYKIVTSAQNKVVDVIIKFQPMAAGAYYNNGFGISFDVAPANVASVTGCLKLGTAVTLDPKGYESGSSTGNNTVIIPVDAVNTLLGGIIVNTVHGGFTVQTTVQTVTMHLSTPQASVGTFPFNPFIFVNQDRSKEVHLKDKPPTALANPIFFGSGDDASNPDQGLYYRSATGLPWAFEIPVNFNYPVEKADILTAYLHFAEWAQSSGASYPDWYMNNAGYRNAANIY
jgi:LruC domain-containing protein